MTTTITPDFDSALNVLRAALEVFDNHVTTLDDIHNETLSELDQVKGELEEISSEHLALQQTVDRVLQDLKDLLWRIKIGPLASWRHLEAEIQGLIDALSGVVD